MLQRNAQWLLALSTLMIPFFYVTGYFYDRGYIESYGLQYSEFTKDVSYYLVNNMMLVIYTLNDVVFDRENIGNAALFVGLSITYISILGCLISTLSSSPNKDAQLIKKFQHKFDTISFIPRFLLNVWKSVKFTLVIFLSIIYVVYFAALSYEKGRDLAKTEMKEPLTCTEKKMSCAYASTEPTSPVPNYLGRIVAKTENDYVIWTGSEVILHPNDSSLKISVPH